MLPVAADHRPLSQPWQLFWACLGVPWMIVALIGLAFHLYPKPGQIGDLAQDWLSAKCYFDGEPIYSSMDETLPRYLEMKNGTGPESVQVNAHPPPSVLLVLPLANLPYSSAKLIWNLVSLACVGVSVALMLSRWGLALDRSNIWPLVVLVVGSAPLASQTQMLQFNGMLLALLTFAWIAQRNGYGWLAGIFIGVAGSIKMFPLFILLVFFALRDWKALAAGVLSFAAMVGISVGVFGVESWRTFITEVMPSVAEWRGAWINASLTGFWSRLFDPGTRAQDAVVPVLLSPALARGLIAGSAVIVSATVFWKGWRAPRESIAARDLAFAAGVFGMLLCSPTTWDHYMLMLVLPLAILWWQTRLSVASSVLFWVCVIALGVVRPGWVQLPVIDPPAHPVHSLTVLAYPCYCLIVLLFLTMLSRGEDAGSSGA